MRSASICAFCAFSALAVGACSSAKLDSGQTGSVGSMADECNLAADCEDRAASEVAALSSPSTSAVHFDESKCILLGSLNGPTGYACVCSQAGGGSEAIGPSGLDCYVYGRAGDCLWPGNGHQSCDPRDATGCDSTCAELEQRIGDDAARSFDASTLYVACEEHQCQSVIEVDGRCFAEGSYTSGRGYDCSLGGESILAAEKAASMPPLQDERPETRSPYVAGTDGMVELTFATRFAGTFESPGGFGAMAQFAIIGAGGNVDYGQIIDPLEGLDDCGVFQGSGTGAAANLDLYDAADVRLLEGATTHAFELSPASHDDFYQYILELDRQNIPPRFDGHYGVHVAGGTFGAAFDSADGLRLPQELAIHALRASSHFEQQDLELTWSGTNDEPLFIQLFVNETLAGVFSNYELQCLVRDDGRFRIPGDLLAAMPPGFASVNFSRDSRKIVRSGAHSLLLLGSVQVTHQFALGPRCYKPEVVEACQAAAEVVSAQYEACNLVPPPLEEQCPDFLASACNTCPEYFDCIAQQTQCTDQGFTTPFGCACP